ncbi:15641_t:CDS:2 [Entrophospora sp. SA101]|nr:15641_t:CDS:2 [Entrophospora sp. SA101]
MGPAPSPRYKPTMTAAKDKIMVFGGDSMSSPKPDEEGIIHILDTSKIKYPPSQNRSSDLPSPPSSTDMSRPFPSPTRSITLDTQSTSDQQRTRHIIPTARHSSKPKTTDDKPFANYPPLSKSSIDSPLSEFSQDSPKAPTEMTNSFPSSTTQRMITQNTTPSRMNTMPVTTYQNSTPQANNSFVPPGFAKRQTTNPPVRSNSPRTLIELEMNSGVGVDIRQGDFQNPRQAPRPPITNNVSTQPYNQYTHSPSQSIRSIQKVNMVPQSMYDSQPEPSSQVIYNNNNGPNNNGYNNKGKNQNISSFKKREMWLRAELELARKAGYLTKSVTNDSTPDGIDVNKLLNIGEPESDRYKIIEAITKIKQELKKSKATIASQAQIASQKIADSERTRTAALQEAAYFKAKLSALMNTSENELASVETERAADLEKRLTQALIEKETLQSKLFQYQQASNNDKTFRESAEESARLATARAEEAEEAHARVLSELTDFQTRATTAETELREMKAQYTGVSSELAQYKSGSENIHNELTYYKQLMEQQKRAFESVNHALISAKEKANESENLWRQARQDNLSLEKETSKLRNKLEAKNRELNRANSKIDETERLLSRAQNEAEAFRATVQEGMKGLFEKSKTNENNLNNLTEADKTNLEKELIEWKTMHAESHNSATEASKSLSEAKLKIIQLESSAMKARQEAVILQGQLTDSLDEAKKIKEKLREKENLLEEKVRALEDAEIKIGMMREDPKTQEFTNNQIIELREQNQKEKEEFNRKFEDIEKQLNSSREEKIMVDQSYEALRKEYESIRQDHKLLKLNNEKLQEQLKKEGEKVKEVQTELEETLSLYVLVNKDLDDALKLAGKASTAGANDDVSGKQLEDLKAERDRLEKEVIKYRENNMKLEVLNVDLVQKLQDSENKVSLLLDQMENAVDTYRGMEDDEMKDSSQRNSQKLTSELDMLTSQFNSNIPDDDSVSDYTNSRWSTHSGTSINDRASSRLEDYDEIMARLDEVKKAAALRNLNQMKQMNQT